MGMTPQVFFYGRKMMLGIGGVRVILDPPRLLAFLAI